MDIRTLNYFIVVAEEMNIGRAAVRLHISQPALTRQIQSLEESFGAPLFIRSVAGVKVTAAGAALLQHARNIRAELALAKRNVLRSDQELRGKIDVGVYGSAVLNVIPDVLNHFSLANPGVEFILHSAPKQLQIEALRRGSVLFAFDRYFPDDPHIASERVYQERMYLAVHRNSPLARKKRVKFSDLTDEIYIQSHPDSEVNPLHDLLVRYEFSPKSKQRTGDVLTAVAMVGSGYGITAVPESLRTLHIPNVVYRPLSSPSERPWELVCAYRQGESSPILQAMLKTVRAYFVAHCSPASEAPVC